MKREDLTEKLLDIKREKGWTWKHIQAEIGGISPILITAACMGQMKRPKAQAKKAAAQCEGPAEGRGVQDRARPRPAPR